MVGGRREGTTEDRDLVSLLLRNVTIYMADMIQISLQSMHKLLQEKSQGKVGLLVLPLPDLYQICLSHLIKFTTSSFSSSSSEKTSVSKNVVNSEEFIIEDFNEAIDN